MGLTKRQLRAIHTKKWYAVVGHNEREAGILTELPAKNLEMAYHIARKKFPHTKDFEVVDTKDSERRMDLSDW